jgi:hypothetical protein
MAIKFRTNLVLSPTNPSISYNKAMLLLGSCFTENIGKHLAHLKFNTCINPFGILYNPLSINEALQCLIKNKQFVGTDLLQHHDQWFSFAHHGRFSSANKTDCLTHINQSLAVGAQSLRTTDVLIITLGTAWVYRLQSNNRVVANCHKLPAKHFKRERLSSLDWTTALGESLAQIKQLNPKLQVIFTLSPIRHWKDGAVENQLSKALLLVGIHELCKQHTYLNYFPAYEIMMDDLRDYRFYAEDLLHPNATAITYIWEQFKIAHLHASTKPLIAAIQKINSAYQHRPIQANSMAHQQFKQQQIQKIQQLQAQYSHLSLDFAEEMRFFGAE